MPRYKPGDILQEDFHRKMGKLEPFLILKEEIHLVDNVEQVVTYDVLYLNDAAVSNKSQWFVEAFCYPC